MRKTIPWPPRPEISSCSVPELLVAPILRQGATARSVYLPSGVWFNFWSGEAIRGGRHVLAEANLEMLPLYVRAGTILPMNPVQQYVDERPVDTCTAPSLAGNRWRALLVRTTANPWSTNAARFTNGKSLSHAANRPFPDFCRCTRRPSQRRAAVAGGLRNTSRPARVTSGGHTVPVRFDPDLALCAFELRNRRRPLKSNGVSSGEGPGKGPTLTPCGIYDLVGRDSPYRAVADSWSLSS